MVGGGLGAGAFIFHYPDFSSLYLAGRDSFDENARFVRSGLERLGLSVEVAETSGAAAARRNLETALAARPGDRVVRLRHARDARDPARDGRRRLSRRGGPLDRRDAPGPRRSTTCGRPRRSTSIASTAPGPGSPRTAIA